MLSVRNRETGPTILQLSDRELFIWQPAGAKDGEDVQLMPSTVLDDLRFIRALQHGSIEIEDPDEEVTAHLAKLRVEVTPPLIRDAQRAAALMAVESTIDRRQERDLLAAACVGPGQRGRTGECGTQVISPAPARGAPQAPPLCKAHEHLAPSLVLVSVPSGDGQTKQIWAQQAQVVQS